MNLRLSFTIKINPKKSKREDLDEDVEEKIVVYTDFPEPMDDLERKTMFNSVDNYEAKEIISSDLEKYRIVRSKLLTIIIVINSNLHWPFESQTFCL